MRRFAAAALATIALLLLPAAIMAHWATVQLVETERFVDALAPLANDPAVQDRIIVEVTGLVDEQLDISGLTDDLLSGLGEALELGPRAQDAIGLISEPVAAGVRALVDDVVSDVVRSPAFSAAWASSVEVLHRQGIRLLAGDPNSLLSLDRQGTLSLPLGPIVAEVRSSLVEQGVPFAAAIPDVDRAIIITELPNLALARVVYQVGISIGTWLPIVCAAMIAGALLLSPRRPLMLRTIGVLAAIVSALLAIGFALGRTALTAYVAPDSSAVVGAIYDAVLGYATTTIFALLVLAIIVVLCGWWLGSSVTALRARAALAALVIDMRAARTRSGFSLGRVGEWMYRQRVAVRFALLALAAVPALTSPPLSVLSVLGCAALGAGLVFVADVLMTPTPAIAATPAKSRTA